MNLSEINSRVVSIGEPDSPARRLACHRTVRKGRYLPLQPRLKAAARAIGAATAGSDWLRGNQQLLRETFLELRQVLPSFAAVPLPVAADGPLLGYPRVFEIATVLVEGTREPIAPESIEPFITDYQSAQVLSMAELWALDMMLKVALLEALGRATPSEIPALITSLKSVQESAWQEFFEENSRTEKILREDPTGDYARMDFATRDRYRHEVEKIARFSGETEERVAQAAIDLALEAGREHGTEPARLQREQHVGYYLIDRGAERVKVAFQYRPGWRARVTDWLLLWPTAWYLITIEVATLAIGATLLSLLSEPLGYLGLIVFFLATEPAIAVANALVTFLLPPRRLPKMDFSEGIPADCVTMAVVPTLLLSEDFVAKLLRSLEVRFLVNRDPRLCFALLTDFPDSATPTDELDHLAGLCADGVRLLNVRYGQGQREPFYLFHRNSEWSPKQATWMGLERKRGKLIALNNLLRGVKDAFQIKAGDLSVLEQIRFVITLDTDTELPPGTAQQLVGTLAHPLNRAVIDPHWNVVREGYGILQPRVGISIDSARLSRLAALYSGQTGYDLYSTAISDVYQDLFGEGSYVGKGIYDVDVFQKTLAKRFPHDLLLSHDLIEGAHARAGLVSDIELIDDYPSHYSAWSKRKHRWTRGDWQIMLWLLPRVPDYAGKLVPNPLSVISHWKIVDNLRRSLMEIAVFVLLLAGWTLLPGGPAYWTAVVLLVTLLPVYIGSFFSLLRLPFNERWATYLGDTARGLISGHVEAIFRLIFLPHQTCLMLDAILRSIVRTKVTGRQLLEWESAAQADLGSKKRSHLETYLWLTVVIAALTCFAIYYANPASLVQASPFLIAWVLSPYIALRLNAPLVPRKDRLSAQDSRMLRGIALRTWQYFADFGCEEHNWLVPDNVREADGGKARRISPTNLGLLLNAHLAAADFGFISHGEMVTNVASIFDTMRKMQRERGHFLNWYDTDTLEPLAPRYVSTVDGGNLAAALIALRQGLLEWKQRFGAGAGVSPATADYANLLMDCGIPPELLRACRAGDLAGAQAEAQHLQAFAETEEQKFWAQRLHAMLLGRAIAEEPDRVTELAHRVCAEVERYIAEMDFSFLLKPKRKLFHTGWNADTAELDPFEYASLASEARIASLIAIAKNDVPYTHWARLGRKAVPASGGPVLLSWSGTIFEYLMPNLWMKQYPDTLLSQTARAAVLQHQEYGRTSNIPWGISESASAEKVEGGDYRYHAFGVPDLAANPEQERSRVVAPYAALLALSVAPRAAIDNLQLQVSRGWLARYGFYEAADFTAGSDQETLVRIFMAHHHGMSLLALDNLLHENCMAERFHKEPMIEAVALLLHEPVVRHASSLPRESGYEAVSEKKRLVRTAA